jgi:hypothetical protein
MKKGRQEHILDYCRTELDQMERIAELEFIEKKNRKSPDERSLSEEMALERQEQRF